MSSLWSTILLLFVLDAWKSSSSAQFTYEVDFRAYSFDNTPDGERYGFISINDDEVIRDDFDFRRANMRGINTIVLDPIAGQIGDQQSFDTCVYPLETERLIDYLTGLPFGTLLFGVTFDEPTQSLANALDLLRSMGLDVATVGYRGMFDFALQKGFPKKTVLAKSASRPNPLKMTVQVTGTSAEDITIKAIDPPVSCAVNLRSYSSDNRPVEVRYASIRVNGTEVFRADYTTNGTRGINTVVLNPRTCLTDDQQSFDTSGSSNGTADLFNYLNGLPSDTILLGVTCDDPFQPSGTDAVNLLKSEYGIDVTSVGKRGMLAFVLQKGYRFKTVLSKAASRTTPLELNVKLSGTIYSVQIFRSA